MDAGGAVLRWLDGTPLGLSAPCPCRSGERVQDCCAALLEYRGLPNPDPHVGVYVTSRDLWPTREVTFDAVRALAREFEPLELLQVLAKIGFVLHKAYSTPHAAEEAEVLERFLPPIWWRKAQLWLQHGGRIKVVHRLAIPAAVQLVMAESGASGSRHRLEEHEQLVGQLLLHLNSVLETDYDRRRTAGSFGGVHRDLIATHSFRLAFFSELESIGPALARHWAIVTRGLPQVAARYPGEYFDFVGEFARRSEFSFQTLTAVALRLIAHYDDLFNQSTRQAERFIVAREFFQGAHSAEVRTTAPRAIDSLARTMAEHAARVQEQLRDNPDNLLQFFPLYERPLLQLENGATMPLDMGYLTSAATEGSYWALFQKLLDERNDTAVSALRSSFGRAFEWYATELLRAAFPASEPRRVWLDWDGDFPTNHASSLPDGIVVEGDTAFVLELTSSGVTPSVATSGDPARLKVVLDSIWFGRGARRESPKLRQLAHSIEALRSGALVPTGFHADAIARFVPVLVTLRPLPRNRLLTQWFADLQRTGGCDETFVRELTVLDPGELEELTRLAMEGLSWNRLWTERSSSPYREDAFHTFLFYRHPRVGLHPILQEWVNDCFNSLTELLTGNRPFPARGTIRGAL